MDLLGGEGRDSPALNLAEGRVLVQMQAVFRAVNKARADKRTTLVLQPGAGTRRIIQPNAGRKQADSPDASAAPTPATTPAPKKTRKRRSR